MAIPPWCTVARYKPVKASNNSKKFDTNPNLYSVFRADLSALLAADDSFKASYLGAEFESKLLDPRYAESPEFRRTAAIEKWLKCEHTNRDTNIRIMHLHEEDFLFLAGDFPVSAVDIADTSARFIARALGDVPFDSLRGSFSGGASTSVKRGTGTIARKYLEGTDICEGAIMHFLRMTKSYAWAPRDFRLVRGNVMFTVPKSTIIDRCACKEPDFNMYAQKAVGDEIRRKLKRSGIDLNDQSVNQRLAKIGCIEGNLATIDLSSASDSVTTQLVLRLMPDDWFHLMNDLRSPETEIDGVWHLNEMFSSMGNGFTFELESLLFWAIARAVAYHLGMKGRISVYGDDIICPVGMFDAMQTTLEFFGFKVNTKKSFSSGPFRESCGSHWHSGVDVTPFYVRKVPVDVSDWCHLLNSLRRWCGAMEMQVADPRYYDLWKRYAEVVPAPLWGGDDLARRDLLVAPGRFPLARVVRKQRQHDAEEIRLSTGCYLHWLDTTSDRLEQSEVVTSSIKSDGDLTLKRAPRWTRKSIPEFPQELGL